MNILEACLGEKRLEWIIAECQTCLEKSVEGKYGRSTEALSVFFVQLCLELLFNEHIYLRPVLVGNDLHELALNFSLCLEKSVEGKYRWSTEAVSLFFKFVQLCLELLSNEHTWACLWWETIWVNCLWMSDLPWKICWRKIRAINRSCVCFLCPVKLRITI